MNADLSQLHRWRRYRVLVRIWNEKDPITGSLAIPSSNHGPAILPVYRLCVHVLLPRIASMARRKG